MYSISFRITGREEDAEDALQEAFISAFKNLESYRADATFGAWLKRIVVNKSINVLKKRKHQWMPEDEQWDVAEEETQVDYREELTVSRVKKAIEELPDGYRTVLSLYLLEGYDHQEIAEIMGISESTSKHIISQSATLSIIMSALKSSQPISTKSSEREKSSPRSTTRSW